MISGKTILLFHHYLFISDINPNVFERQPSVSTVVNQVNTTMFNSGTNKNYDSFTEFTRTMWNCIDKAIEIHECEIYTFSPARDAEIDDPFAERGVM